MTDVSLTPNEPTQSNYVHVHEPCPHCDGCIYECDHRVKTKLTVSSSTPNEQTCPTCGEDGSKPYSVCSDAWHLLASETGYEAEIDALLTTNYLIGPDSLMAHWSRHDETDQQFADLIVEHNEEAKAAIKAMLSKAEVANTDLLKAWLDLFDDDGNLDGYGSKSVKTLQQRTWAALKKQGGDI